jgi:hypothetical protein
MGWPVGLRGVVFMLIKKPADILSSEITSKGVYLNRRKFLTGTAIAGAAVLAGQSSSRLGFAFDDIRNECED